MSITIYPADWALAGTLASVLALLVYVYLDARDHWPRGADGQRGPSFKVAVLVGAAIFLAGCLWYGRLVWQAHHQDTARAVPASETARPGAAAFHAGHYHNCIINATGQVYQVALDTLGAWPSTLARVYNARDMDAPQRADVQIDLFGAVDYWARLSDQRDLVVTFDYKRGLCDVLHLDTSTAIDDETGHIGIATSADDVGDEEYRLQLAAQHKQTAQHRPGA